MDSTTTAKISQLENNSSTDKNNSSSLTNSQNQVSSNSASMDKNITPVNYTDAEQSLTAWDNMKNKLLSKNKKTAHHI